MMNLDNRKLTLIWEDILMEHGGKETVYNFKKEYSNYSIEYLLDLAKSLLKSNTENHPFRYQIFIGDFLDSDSYTVIYSQNEIDYKELIVSLATLMTLTNIEDRPQLIVNLAQALHKMDREISDRFANDIAEEVYRYYR